MGLSTIAIVTTAERLGYTPIASEIVWDEDLEEPFIGDGTTVGGVSLIGATGPTGPAGSGLSDVVDDLTPQLGGFLDPNGKYVGRAKGGDIASATPLVALTDGDYANVTGTTGFSSITIAANRNVRYRFTGVLTIVQGANLLLNNAAGNYTTAVGDIIDFQSTAANTVVGTIIRADGTSLKSSATLTQALDTNAQHINTSRATVASHATTSAIWAALGNEIDFTGTETITDLPAAGRAGSSRVLHCAGAVVFTDNANLDVQGGTYTAAAGDIVTIRAITTTTFTATIAKEDGTAVSGGVPQNSQSAAYTTVLGDNGKHIYHPGADTTARIWTIDSNANVPYPIGAAITFMNDVSAGALTISITSDTLVFVDDDSTGSRTIAATGTATALKVTATRWLISGVGVT